MWRRWRALCAKHSHSSRLEVEANLYRMIKAPSDRNKNARPLNQGEASEEDKNE